MVDAFVGRHAEIARLDALLERVRNRGTAQFVSMRGRRQVGKSRLASEFLRRAGVPSAFFAASRGADPASERRRFAEIIARSSLQAAALFEAIRADDWLVLLRSLAEHTTTPSVVILDELPYLLAGDTEAEGLLQTAWDRYLSQAPIMLVALGSNLSMMEQLTSYGRPLFGRMRELRLDPLTVADTAAVTGLEAADAIDAHLVVGGYPRVLSEWEPHTTLAQFFEQQLSDSTSPLVVVGERIVTAEFPDTLQAGTVLRAIGAGERTFTGIARRLDINQGSLTRALRTLTEDTRVVTAARPLSRRRSGDARYLVSDPYLRFWLRFVQPQIETIFRGRPDVVLDNTLAGWPTYRGAAVEPVVRSSIERLLPGAGLGDTNFVGSYWNRTGDLEVDLVGADRDTSPATVAMLGSIKWRERRPFRRDDLLALAAARAQVPGGADATLVGVSRSGFETSELDAALSPDDLIRAWRT